MRTSAARRAVLACLLMCSFLSPRSLIAGGIGVSDPPDSIATDSTLSTSGAASITDLPFHLYKARVDRAPRGYRDFDFLWSDTFKSRLRMPLDSLSGVEQINDLQRLAETMCELPGTNPLGLPWTDLQLSYNFLARAEGYRDAEYNSVAQAPIGFKVAQPNYVDAERNHLDTYVYSPGFEAYGQWETYLGDGNDGVGFVRGYGVFPSQFEWSAEDSLTSPAGAPQHLNSIMLPGPLPSGVAATDASRWTRPGGTANAYLNHEGMHAINGDGFSTPSVPFLHMFASGAEVVTGVSSDAPRYDVDYTCSLSPTGDNISNAYPHWQSFMAYLAFNWRGTNTTPAGWQDDLLPRWATAPAAERDFPGLAKRLRDSECGECVAYPGFVGLDSLARVQRLVHDWRVASYVNNSSLPGGRYGFPPEFGFSPADQLGAWQDVDPGASNSVSVPPVITVGPSPAARSQWFTDRPAGPGFGPRPLRMKMFGAEYFVFKADPVLAANPQTLTVRVRPGLVRRHYVNTNSACQPSSSPPDDVGRIHASVVSYSQGADDLFRHPDWATGVITKTALLDSLRGDLEFEIAAFGGTTAAVLLVVSLGDGPTGTFSITDKYGDAPPMSLGVGVFLDDRNTPVTGRPIAWTQARESQAAWSPDGARLAYRQLDADGSTRIYLRNSDGSGPAMPLRSASAGQSEPAWSPRGDKVAYVEADTAGQIWFVDVASGVAQAGISQSGLVHEPTYSPDGARLAYFREWVTTVVEPDPPPREGDLAGIPVVTRREEVRVRDLTSGADTSLVQFIRAEDDSTRQMVGLRWTSDSRFLTFSRFDPDSARIRLHQLEMRTRALTAHDGQAPEARVRELSPGAGPVLTEEAAGVPYEVVCNPAAFVFCGCRPQAFDLADWIAVRDTTAGTSTHLGYRAGAIFTNPRWSPDGTRVAYSTTQNGNEDVYVIAATLDRAPAFSSSVLTYYSFSGCNPFELTLAASDPDGSPVTFRVSGLPAGASLQNGFRVYWPATVVGDHWFVAQALDPEGAVATRLIHLNVYDGGDCGGGGGGEGEGEIIPGGRNARPAELARGISGTAPRAVSSFLDGAAEGEWVEQTARLFAARTDASNRVTTRIVGLRPGEFRLDRARLVVVDHDPALLPVATDAGVVLGASRAPAGVAVTGGVGAADGLVPAGTTITVEWTEADSIAGLMMDCARAGAVDTTGDGSVSVEVRDGGGWRLVGRIRPRSGYDALALPLEGATQARLSFCSDTYVREIAGYSLTGARQAEVTRLSCSSASLDGAAAAVGEADGSPVTLGRGQSVALSFDAPMPAEGLRRTLFLELVASFTPSPPVAAQSGRMGGGAPLRFALHPGQPNPFERAMQIRFEVPHASTVRLEVFDALGRRVRTLADRSFPPGVHALEWDGTDGVGRRAAPGVYLVRMLADGFRAERRVVQLGR